MQTIKTKKEMEEARADAQKDVCEVLKAEMSPRKYLVDRRSGKSICSGWQWVPRETNATSSDTCEIKGKERTNIDLH